MDPKRGVINWETRTDIYTPSCVKQATSEPIEHGAGKAEAGSVCRTYIELISKCIPIYIRCTQILFDSTYTRYLEQSNSYSQKVHWEMPGPRGWRVRRGNGNLKVNKDRVLAQEGEKLGRWKMARVAQQCQQTQCH